MSNEAEKLPNLKDIPQLCCDRPFLRCELEHVQSMLSGAAECVDGGAVLNRDVQHIVCQIPSSLDIARDEPVRQAPLLQDITPCRKDDSCRVYYFESQTPNLSSV